MFKTVREWRDHYNRFNCTTKKSSSKDTAVIFPLISILECLFCYDMEYDFFFCPFFVRTSLLQCKGLRDVILKISNKNNKLLHNYKQLTHLQFGKENTVEVIIPKFKYFLMDWCTIWCWHLWIGKALLLPQREGVCHYVTVWLSVCLQSRVHIFQDIMLKFCVMTDTNGSSSWFNFGENWVKGTTNVKNQ